MRQANILDPINEDLDQAIFNGITPKRSVQDFIKRLYYRALDQRLHVKGEEWADLYMTGSLTTYQYSATSDCDVSVFPNYDLLFEKLNLSPEQARRELISLSIEHIDGTFLPGSTHPLQFFVVPQETLPSDLYKPGLRSAFDLHDSVWFQEPEKDRVHDITLEYPELYRRAQDMADKLTEMLDSGDDDAADELWHQIHKKRQLDQQAGLGDFCEGNIVYKYLLNAGLFDRIREELHEYIAKTGAVKWSLDLWEDRVTQKVIYDFDKDTITLGTQATQAEHPDSKIIGEYDDGIVTLFDADKQWITPAYFHKLWHFSYPGKELKDVYYQPAEGDPYKLRTVRKRKRSAWKLTFVPKFLEGDSVVMKAYGESGRIVGEPYQKDGEWWYLVHTYDDQGPVGDVLYPERDMSRPTRYDDPEEMTIKDMFGITPEGEDYFRKAPKDAHVD